MSVSNQKTQPARKKGRHVRQKLPKSLQWVVSIAMMVVIFLIYFVLCLMFTRFNLFNLTMKVKTFILIGLGLIFVLFCVIIGLYGDWKRPLCAFLVCLLLYIPANFSKLSFIEHYRTLWIQTAYSTMRNQGLMHLFLPMVTEPVVNVTDDGYRAQIGVNSDENHDVEGNDFANDPEKLAREAAQLASEAAAWVAEDPENRTVDQYYDQVLTPDSGTGNNGGGQGGESGGNTPSIRRPSDLIQQDPDYFELDDDRKYFYGLFYELDRQSAEAYFTEHPDAKANGYRKIFVNKSSLNSSGTSIRTKLGEKVLAIDTENKILIVEFDADGSRGVLAIAKDPSKLHLFAATTLPSIGQTAGVIAKNNGGILAMTGSGFIDEGGVGMGGEIAGYAMCGGKSYGTHYGWGYKRMELREDNWFYIQDAPNKCGAGTTDCMEFQPAMIVNGQKQNVGIWTSLNPRACIGQSERGEILMLTVEGRRVSSPGCSLTVCTDRLLQHDCLTAMNCDGGTTAIMWYRGEPIMRCSNSAIPQGRYLPNAWVIVGN